MIDYGAKAGRPDWRTFFQLHGSVFPHCFFVVFPVSLLSWILKIMQLEGIATSVTSFEFLSDGTAWGSFSSLVIFVLVFRLSNAYNTFWSAYGATNAMLGDWSGAAASLVTFVRGNKVGEDATDKFLHAAVRLFSILSACALQELSPREAHKVWGLLTLNSVGIDEDSLRILDGSDLRVDLCYHWIQQLVLDNMQSGVVSAPPPIVGRVFGELSAGMGKFGDAKKHALNQFNFPYAQTTRWLKIIYTVFLPFMMVRWANWSVSAFIFTFLVLFFIWALDKITTILESPFDTSNPNCIDVYELQRGLNNSLALLLDPNTRAGPPRLDEHRCRETVDHEELQKRDTIHKAALKNEGWLVKQDEVKKKKGSSGPLADAKAEDALTPITPTRSSSSVNDDADPETGCCSCCSSCCCSCTRNKADSQPITFAVSSHYRAPRFGIINETKTHVLAIGIYKGHLIVAVPPTFASEHGNDILAQVEDQNGKLCNIFLRKVLIKDRHKFLEQPPNVEWLHNCEHKFVEEYPDIVQVLGRHRRKIERLSLSRVATESQIKTAKKIAEAMKADVQGLGVDKMMNLKSYMDFVDALMEECGFSRDAAAEEWQRRKSLPHEFEQGLDDRGCVMIELDLDEFRKTFQKLEAEKKAKETKLAKIRTGIVNARLAGTIAELRAAIQKAESSSEAPLPDQELQDVRQVLKDWKEMNEKLLEVGATQCKDQQRLEEHIKASDQVGFKGEGYKQVKEILKELVAEQVRRELPDAKSRGDKAAVDALLSRAKTAGVRLDDDWLTMSGMAEVGAAAFRFGIDRMGAAQEAATSILPGQPEAERPQG
eukprot:TRINITY_DN120983_c0_g1_i1.p1 TRINITY_DN120983_c0_g1~~TRINITY_DN120983_c0_g1_i1.p1  ORF type:complete len:825 (+),score=204.50 TRINITY_DN120983_c0_g1_i1:136-2610(+)